MTLTELLRTISDIAEIAVTVMLAYVVYRVAILLESLSSKVKGEKT
jgi:hypothetical protein